MAISDNASTPSWLGRGGAWRQTSRHTCATASLRADRSQWAGEGTLWNSTSSCRRPLWICSSRPSARLVSLIRASRRRLLRRECPPRHSIRWATNRGKGNRPLASVPGLPGTVPMGGISRSVPGRGDEGSWDPVRRVSSMSPPASTSLTLHRTLPTSFWPHPQHLP